MIDWSKCPDAESVPDRCSGAWVVKNTRVMVQGILDNAEDCSAAEVAEMFGLPVDVVKRILAFAESEARVQRAFEAGLAAVHGVIAKWRADLMQQLRQLPRDGSAEQERAEIIRQLDDLNPR